MEVTIVFTVMLAFIPAVIAKVKNRSFFAYYLLGFCLPLISIIIVACLPDLHDSNSQIIQKSKDVFVRNTYMNIPMRPFRATIFSDEKGNLLSLSVFVRMYEEVDCDTFRVSIQEYDVFENLLCEATLTVPIQSDTDGGVFFEVDNIKSDIVKVDIVEYLEVYIDAYAKGSNYVKFDEAKKCDYIIPVAELSDFKNKYGFDAIVPPENKKDYWVCACGNKCDIGVQCPVCKRVFSITVGASCLGLNAFLAYLPGVSDPTEIKNIFIRVKDNIPDEKYYKTLDFLEQLELRKSSFGIVKINDNQKAKIYKLLGSDVAET